MGTMIPPRFEINLVVDDKDKSKKKVSYNKPVGLKCSIWSLCPPTAVTHIINFFNDFN